MLLSGTVAILGYAWMFQIRVQTASSARIRVSILRRRRNNGGGRGLHLGGGVHRLLGDHRRGGRVWMTPAYRQVGHTLPKPRP
ncbi:uncharacterized protein LOC114357013 isoform X3 [Ostrinia furnacalis]|uniref:uncharacterized protein LOC114357013 isoform X3 n=1 Tax=Ostrinia furnacalis TaxID=93504 RepID=UPI00103B33C3|nr:uncharacterized protein LOC114357013 isoform X3 [Ostrinia furnacalis]